MDVAKKLTGREKARQEQIFVYKNRIIKVAWGPTRFHKDGSFYSEVMDFEGNLISRFEDFMRKADIIEVSTAIADCPWKKSKKEIRAQGGKKPLTAGELAFMRRQLSDTGQKTGEV